MTAHFLERLTFAALIAPAPEQKFRTSYWEQKPLVVHRGSPDFYGDLFTLADFDEALTRTPSYVKIANATIHKTKAYRAAMAEGIEAVLADMRDGGTLVLDQLQNRDPKLGLLCRILGAEFGHRFHTNVYLTPPRGKGFTPHWDNHDVFILQVAGSKHWKIEKKRRAFPRRDEKISDAEGELRGDTHAFTLKQGDLAYIPRGYVHAAECGEESSLHITLGVAAIFFDEVLHAAIAASVLDDQGLRAALPPGFMRGGTQEIVQQLLSTFRRVAEEEFLTHALDQFRNELVAKYPLDVSGQVVEFFQPRPLALDDTVRPRPGTAYRISAGDDAVRLNVGARTITFPGFFRQPLDFALNTPGYAVREIAGELEDEERIALVERLIEEGLVVRNRAEAK